MGTLACEAHQMASFSRTVRKDAVWRILSKRQHAAGPCGRLGAQSKRCRIESVRLPVTSDAIIEWFALRAIRCSASSDDG